MLHTPKAIHLLVSLGLFLFLTACAAAPPTPTVTPIPLAATATPQARPTQPPSTAVSREPTRTPSPATPAPLRPEPLAALDDLLVERTVQGFLSRLLRGELESALRLYLTEAARQRNPRLLFDAAFAANGRLVEATLLSTARLTPTSFEAQVLLRWEEGSEGRSAIQPMTLGLLYERGLWLIDSIVLGERQSPTPTAKPQALRNPAALQKLSGKIAFQVSSGGAVYVINADGTGLRQISHGLDPAWSPNGNQLALTRWETPAGLILVNLDGTEERIVDIIRPKEAAWSPDGRLIAFTIHVSSAEPVEYCFRGFCFRLPPFSWGQMWVVNLDDDKLLSLPMESTAMHSPTWNAKGDRIVYAGVRGLAWIDLANPGTLEQLQVTARGLYQGGSAWDGSPSFSPDGSQIAFMGRVHDRWEIFVMNADGSARRPLTFSDPQLKPAPNNVAPTWSPDGRQIAFLSDRDGPWRIYVMNADGSGQRPMFGSALDALGIRYEFASERVLSWTR